MNARHYYDNVHAAMEWDEHHPVCRCGCGELADECAGSNPSLLGSMRVVSAEGTRAATPQASASLPETRGGDDAR